jgi:hypothetical protein
MLRHLNGGNLRVSGEEPEPPEPVKDLVRYPDGDAVAAPRLAASNALAAGRETDSRWPPDEVLDPLYRSGEPRDLGGMARQWLDLVALAAPTTIACDGERRWRVYQDRTMVGPADPCGTTSRSWPTRAGCSAAGCPAARSLPTAARAAAEAVNRTTGAVSAARSFLDDLRGHR